jgi:hypothetical protein
MLVQLWRPAICSKVHSSPRPPCQEGHGWLPSAAALHRRPKPPIHSCPNHAPSTAKLPVLFSARLLLVRDDDLEGKSCGSCEDERITGSVWEPNLKVAAIFFQFRESPFAIRHSRNSRFGIQSRLSKAEADGQIPLVQYDGRVSPFSPLSTAKIN